MSQRPQCSPSPTPDYETVEEAEVLMEEVEAEKDKARSPEYKAPGESPKGAQGAESCIEHLLHPELLTQAGIWTQTCSRATPATLAERRKRKEDKVVQDQK